MAPAGRRLQVYGPGDLSGELSDTFWHGKLCVDCSRGFGSWSCRRAVVVRLVVVVVGRVAGSWLISSDYVDKVLKT